MDSSEKYLVGFIMGAVLAFVGIFILVLKFDTSDAACVEAHYKKIALESCDIKQK